MSPKYDQIGIDYAKQRKSDPRIAEQINRRLEGAQRILNIGAGTGSYEPTGVDLIALEPSSEMIAQRGPNTHLVIQGTAEQLPFEDKSFSHTMTVLSMHHWTDRKQAFSEIKRVTREKFVAISWDPEALPFWLTKDYFPEIYDTDQKIFLSVDEFETHFNQVKRSPLLIPHNCIDGFLAAYWRRPATYLEASVRQSISTFSKLVNLEVGLNKLRTDLDQGLWHQKNEAILDLEWFDAGYVIVEAEIES